MKPQMSLLVLLHMFHSLFSIFETPSFRVLNKKENNKKRKKNRNTFHFFIYLPILGYILQHTYYNFG